MTLSGAVNAAKVGSTSYGYVDKYIYGNLNSPTTVVIVIGMHPLEKGSHQAMESKLKSMPSTSNKRYILYKITVTQNANDYNKGRINGQLLAQKFIVPDVSQYKPILLMDIHENKWKDSGYKYGRFLYLIKPTNLTNAYANYIKSKITFLVSYTPPNPTSPPYMAIPIANKWIPVIIYENYLYDSQAKKNTDMSNLINILNSMPVLP